MGVSSVRIATNGLLRPRWGAAALLLPGRMTMSFTGTEKSAAEACMTEGGEIILLWMH